MSRSVFVLGLGIAAVGLAFGLTDWLLRPSPGVMEANVRRIRPGMKMAEVESILGSPGQRLMGAITTTHRVELWNWTGPQGSVFVRFGGGFGAPLVVEWTDSNRAAASGPLKRLRSWLGW